MRDRVNCCGKKGAPSAPLMSRACSLTWKWNCANVVAVCCARRFAVLRASYAKNSSVVSGVGLLYATRRTKGR